jgi:predicted DNA-binding transcriptional regulator AlpA
MPSKKSNPKKPSSPRAPILRSGLRYVRMREILQRTGLSRTTIWRLARKGKFVPFYPLTGCRAIGVRSDEFERWLESRNCIGPNTAQVGHAA